MNLFGRYFKLSFLFITLALILSFVAYFFPLFNKVAFFVILALTLILTLEKLEYGIYILLAELFIGSKGYLFYFDFSGTSVSLRIAMFLVVMGVWLANSIIARKAATKQSRDNKIAAPLALCVRTCNGGLMKWYWILFIFIVWGFVWGITRGNSFQNVFFDFNAWLYFALIFPLAEAIKSREQIENILQILTAAVTIIVIKTFFLLYVFSHGLEVAMYPLYRWLRQFLIGEITLMDSSFYRIFFQSQIYVLIGFFIFIALLLIVIARNAATKQSFNKEIAIPPSMARNDQKIIIYYLLIIVGCLASILVSFSRSLWFGLVFGLFALLVFLIIKKFPFGKILKIGLCGLAVLIAAVSIIFITVKFPYPAPEKISLASMFENRLTDLSEAAVRSRWDLLPPLGRAIIKHPIIGSGFGTTVTYKSSDPRALQFNPAGEFTTYAFEWGYLDILLKIGLAGLIVYLILIGKICKNGWREIKSQVSRLETNGVTINYQQSTVNSQQSIVKSQKFLISGLFLGLTALLTTNFFSPYLNHPLGIGYIVLCSSIFAVISTTIDKKTNL